jgi:hypothetical protein
MRGRHEAGPVAPRLRSLSDLNAARFHPVVGKLGDCVLAPVI